MKPSPAPLKRETLQQLEAHGVVLEVCDTFKFVDCGTKSFPKLKTVNIISL